MRELENLNASGVALANQGRFQEAREIFFNAFEKSHDHAETISNLGSVLNQLGDYRGALECSGRLLKIQPDDPFVFCHHGNVLKHLGEIDQSLETFRLGLRAHPLSLSIWSDYLLALNFANVPADEIWREHRRFGSTFETRIPKNSQFFNESGKGKSTKLRLGFLGADFCNHAVSAFSLALFKYHDPDQVEIYVYNNGSKVDELTLQFKKYTHLWRDIVGVNDESCLQWMVSDRLDAMIDLSGHTRNNRLSLLMRKPAPVQISWFSYMNTTGLSAMDYRFVDRITKPVGAEFGYSEELINLDNLFPYIPVAGLVKLPEKDLAKPFVFGSFNNFAKINSQTVHRWSEILRVCKDAKFLIHISGDQKHKENRLRWLESLGINPKRVEVVPELPIDLYMKRLSEVDLLLDTSPYGGGVSTADGLSVGVPMVTLLGDRETSRASASILTTAGLGNFVARSNEEYVGIAIAAAKYRKESLRLESEKLQKQTLTEPKSIVQNAISQVKELVEKRQIVKPNWAGTKHSKVATGAFSKVEIESYLRLSKLTDSVFEKFYNSLGLVEAYRLLRRVLTLRMGWREGVSLPIVVEGGLIKEQYRLGYPLLEFSRKLRVCIAKQFGGKSIFELYSNHPGFDLFPEDSLVTDDPRLSGKNVFKSIEFQEIDLLIDSLIDHNYENVRNRLRERVCDRSVAEVDEETYWRLPSHLLQSSYLDLHAIFNKLQIKAKDIVVDLGSGLGRLGFFMGIKYPEVKVVGYEIVHERVLEAQRVARLMRFSNSVFSQQDLADLSFSPIEADYYFAYEPVNKETLAKIFSDLREISKRRAFTLIAMSGNGPLLGAARSQSWLTETISRDRNWKFGIFKC